VRTRGVVVGVVVLLLLGSLVLFVGAAPAASAGTPVGTVTTFEDLPPDPSDGQFTLREAFAAANADGLPSAITLQAGEYELTICPPGLSADGNTVGDLDHTGAGQELIISGGGLGGGSTTIRQTCPGTRVLENATTGRVVLIDLTITGGTVTNVRGAGIRTDGPLDLDDSRVVGNVSSGTSTESAGGGIAASDEADLTLEDSLVWGNEAFRGGGIHAADDGFANADVDLLRSTIGGNVARSSAGGLSAGNLELVDSTLVGNQALGGNAGDVAGGFSFFTQLTRSTVTGNVAHGDDSIAIYGLALQLDRSIVAGNPVERSCGSSGFTTDEGFNVTDDCFDAHGVTTIDDVAIEGLRAPFWNGGPTPTVWLDDDSQALDHIPAASCTGATDQRGADRPGGSACDAGAVEVQACGDQFADVATLHPFCAEVGWMAEAGISAGFEPGPTYRPSVAVSRGAMSAFMYRLAGSPPSVDPASPTFADVGTTHPFFAEVEWMASEGITTGTPASPKPLYKPSAPVSRGAMSAFMFRLAGEPEVDPPASPTFGDVGATHPFFAEVEWMAEAGITTGTAASPKPLYKPGDAVSRQAMSAFMFRLADGHLPLPGLP
jgi:hypothetical protein